MVQEYLFWIIGEIWLILAEPKEKQRIAPIRKLFMYFHLSKSTSDSIRIVAALMVVLCHYDLFVYGNQFSDLGIYRISLPQFGFFGVAVFFFLSGYGLMESEQKSHLNLLKYFKKRILKIFLPLLTVSFLWMIASPFLLTASPFNGIEIEIFGDRTLIISNILVDFGDSVLWFMKPLFLLYILFFIYSYVRIWNFTASVLFLVLIAIGSTLFIAHTISEYASVSVPFFFLGILLSQNKKNTGIILVMTLLGLIAMCDFIILRSSYLTLHTSINALSIAILILIFSVRKTELRIPSIITALSFDIYLVHNKVMIFMQQHVETVRLIPYLFLTLIASIAFYYIRTKLLRAK